MTIPMQIMTLAMAGVETGRFKDDATPNVPQSKRKKGYAKALGGRKAMLGEKFNAAVEKRIKKRKNSKAGRKSSRKGR